MSEEIKQPLNGETLIYQIDMPESWYKFIVGDINKTANGYVDAMIAVEERWKEYGIIDIIKDGPDRIVALFRTEEGIKRLEKDVDA